jgi:hypothetical protein
MKNSKLETRNSTASTAAAVAKPAPADAVKNYARLARRRHELAQKLHRVEKEMELAHAEALRALGPEGVACAFGMNLKVREKLRVKPVHDTRSLVNAIIDSGPDFHHMLTCHFPTLIGWAAGHIPTGPLGLGRGIWQQVDPTEYEAIDARRAGKKGTGGEV